MQDKDSLSFRSLSAFFIPLGIAASLTSITHVIINGTLSRGDNAEFIIACFAVAMSVFGIVEKPMIIFRQTSSALVIDRYSFKLLRSFFLYILLYILSISFIIGFTPLGDWMYTYVFNATEKMVPTISDAFKVITLVIIFSGFRGLYQGIIINQLETKWLTIGVIVRLSGMFILSFLFIHFDYVTSVSGAFIFLLGMFIECAVSVYKSRSLLKTKVKKEADRRLLKEDISRFYFPLVFYFLMQTVLIPVIYILLAQTDDIELSIASFALAFSITNMILGFFMYTHQLVLQFYKEDKQTVIKFVIVLSVIPSLILSILCYTDIGMVFMQTIMGADESLAVMTLEVLKFFIIKTLVFPWIDFLNGFLMAQRKTNRMLIAQFSNMLVVIISLLIFVKIFPYLNGINGSIAAAIGEVVGLLVVGLIAYRMSNRYKLRQK